MAVVRTRYLLLNRNFVLLWCAYGISAMGDHLTELSLLASQHALDKEVGVTLLYARMTFLFFLPFFLFGPIAGLLSDLLPRKALMIGADLARCGLMFLFPLFLIDGPSQGSWLAFSPLFFVGVFAAIFSPARASLLPNIVVPDHLVRANALISGLGIIATMAAQQIGGYLADRGNLAFAFQLDGITFLASAALVALIAGVPRPPKPKAKDHLQSLVDGFRYVGSHRRVLQLVLLITVVWGSGILVNLVIPAIVRDIYKGTYTDIGRYRAFLGVGFLGGSLILAGLGRALRSEIAITWAMMGGACATTLLAVSALLPFQPGVAAVIGGIAIVLAGMFGVAVIASVNALLQQFVPDRFLGRVMGVRDTCTIGAVIAVTAIIGIPEWPRMDRWAGGLLLAAAAAFLVAGLSSLWLRLKDSPLSSQLAFWVHLNEFFARMWYRFDRDGICTIPRRGSVIVTANHTSPADPMLLYAACGYRSIAFMIAREYANLPIARYFTRLVHCIPVNRTGQDVAATKTAMRLLKEGGAIAIFIEGTIPDPGQSVDPKDGVAMLALKTGATVIPAHIRGTRHAGSIWAGLMARHRARVRFGPPVDLSEFHDAQRGRASVRRATRKIFQAVLDLRPDSVNKPDSLDSDDDRL